MSLDFLDSLIARELGTAPRVRPVPAFYGEALEEQAEREPYLVPPPRPSRPARRDRPAPAAPAAAAPEHVRAEPEPAAPPAAQAAPPPHRTSRPPARRAASPELAPPPSPSPDREPHADPRSEERLPRPPRTSDASAALESTAEPDAPYPRADEAEPPAVAQVETLRPVARRARVPAGSVAPGAALPAVRPAGGRTDSVGDEDAITISIGRIDVRAAPPPAPLPSPVPRRPSTSLDDWLAECDAAGRG